MSRKQSRSPGTVSPAASPRKPWILFAGVFLIASAAVAVWISKHFRIPFRTETPPVAPGFPKRASDQENFSAYAGSAACRDCHEQAFNLWAKSHHALAERAVDAALDGSAFDPPHRIQHGSQTSVVHSHESKFQIETQGSGGAVAAFEAERVLGVEPLRQFLFAFPQGRWQAGELAFDPHKKEWFNVFGNEDRHSPEWGHWTGRGMNWNSMCASCHNTRVQKNYDSATDTYTTRMAERGIGCEACHGPMKSHVTWQRNRPPSGTADPTVRRLDKNQMLDTCGSCHARRGELTGEFMPGDHFFDHFTLTIPDETELYYPDGQVREEDYEFTSFLSSGMYHAGVRCGDCHEPHSSRPLLSGDALCMRCHGAPVPPAPKIDPAVHTHHAPESAGSRCVNCHMPQTTFMQRHARRDHGFTIPDPLLTQQHGIPNACNRCHTDRTVDWAVAAVEQWYGTRMERPTRHRARAMAEARAGQPQAATNLVRVLAEEKIPLWRASAARLLRFWNHDPAVRRALFHAVIDPDPLVRAQVPFALEGLFRPEDPALTAVGRELLRDPSRSVRVPAAWAMRASLDTNSPAALDLLSSLEFNRDQPAGLHQLAIWHFDRGDTRLALQLFRTAVEWDGGSAPLRHSLAMACSTEGQSVDAVRELEAACRLAPQDALYRYHLGLALNETGDLPKATAALQRSVELDPRLAPAWYNLGLAHAAAENLPQAVEALVRAETLQPENPRVPYARATALARLGKHEEARNAARRALEIQPGFSEALQLLQMLPRTPAQ
jgi:Flp pilus assembly protein TadD